MELKGLTINYEDGMVYVRSHEGLGAEEGKLLDVEHRVSDGKLVMRLPEEGAKVHRPMPRPPRKLDTEDEIRELGNKFVGFNLWGVRGEDMDAQMLKGFIVFLDNAHWDLVKAVAPEGVLEEAYKNLKAHFDRKHAARAEGEQ